LLAAGIDAARAIICVVSRDLENVQLARRLASSAATFGWCHR